MWRHILIYDGELDYYRFTIPSVAAHCNIWPTRRKIGNSGAVWSNIVYTLGVF